jgi:TonB family protein
VRARGALLFALAVVAACGGAPARRSPGPYVPMQGAPGARVDAEPAASPAALGAGWLGEVHARLHDKWADGFLEQARVYLPASHPVNDTRLATQLGLAVRPSGELVQVSVVEASGNADFDRGAREVMQALSPLPAPPGELLSDDNLVHVRWLLARDARQDSPAGAAVEVRTLPTPQAVPALLAAGRIDAAAGRLAAALRAGDGGAQVALARDVAGAVLTAVVRDASDPGERAAAVRGLASSGWRSADPVLRQLAVEAPDLLLQSAALRALGDLGDAEAVPLCQDALTKGGGERAAAAAYALARLGRAAEVWRVLAPRVAAADEGTRLAALAELGPVGAEDSAPALAAILSSRIASRAERSLAAAGLGALSGAAAARALVAALADGDAAVRAAAAGALAGAASQGLRGRGVYFAVEPLLRDRDPRVQVQAARAAALLGGKAALPELALLAARARDPEALLAAVAATGEARVPEAEAPLRRYAKSDNPDVRAAALRALAGRAEADARALVVAHLDDEDARARTAAVSATVDPARLTHALADPDLDARAAAVAALVKAMGEPGAAPAVLDELRAARETPKRVALAAAYLRATAR